MTRVSDTVIVMLLIQESFFRENMEIKRGVQIWFGFRFNPYIVQCVTDEASDMNTFFGSAQTGCDTLKFLISSLTSGLFSIVVLQLIYTRFHTSY